MWTAKASGNARARVLLDTPRDYGPARFSPDGKRVALSILSISNTRSDIWIYDIGSATLTKLISEGEQNFRPEWTRMGGRCCTARTAAARARSGGRTPT